VGGMYVGLTLGSPWYCVYEFNVMKPIKGLVNSIVNGPEDEK
jgi:hypothetical protein